MGDKEHFELDRKGTCIDHETKTFYISGRMVPGPDPSDQYEKPDYMDIRRRFIERKIGRRSKPT